MNTDTLDKMRQLRLFGMHRSFRNSLESPKHEQLTVDEITALLVDSEWDERHALLNEVLKMPASVISQPLSN